jgi:DNA-directed RNA polymerase specialized sigma24 family protein
MQLRGFESYTDETLLELLMKDDLSAFEAIYNRYWLRLYSTGFKCVKIKEATEEIVQDIFSNLWIDRHTSNVQSLSPYLFSNLKYKVIQYMSHQIIKRSSVKTEFNRNTHLGLNTFICRFAKSITNKPAM